MGNLFDYLAWRGDLSLQTDPFHDVDAMILSRFAYVPFEYRTMPLADRLLPIRDLAEPMLADGDLDRNRRWELQDRDLLTALAESRRFSPLEAGFAESVRQSAAQVQFSAITVQLAPDLYILCFRGTDNTVIGWKEDLNMAELCPVPAQKRAVDYVTRVAERVPGRLILCGHSKGGNLAVYAAAFAPPAVQQRLEAVYNFDGPGFFDDVLQQEGYQRMMPLVHTYVPQFSVVGMLLGHPEGHTVVRSDETGIMQHDTYSWQMCGASFVVLETVTGGSRFVDATLKEWTAGMTPAQRENLVEAIYTVLSDTRMRTMRDMRENWLETGVSFLRSLAGMDERTRTAASEALKMLARSAGREAREALENQPVLGEKVRGDKD